MFEKVVSQVLDLQVSGEQNSLGVAQKTVIKRLDHGNLQIVSEYSGVEPTRQELWIVPVSKRHQIQ
jgi:hypothetical protein